MYYLEFEGVFKFVQCAGKVKTLSGKGSIYMGSMFGLCSYKYKFHDILKIVSVI